MESLAQAPDSPVGTPLTVSPAEVDAAARKLVGARYKPKARDMEQADCIGLLVMTARLLHIDHGFDYREYRQWPDGHTLQREMRKVLVEDAKPIIAPGKIALFFQPNLKRDLHCGIFGLNNTFIEASVAEGRVVRMTWDAKRYPMKLVKTWDYPEVAAWRAEHDGH